MILQQVVMILIGFVGSFFSGLLGIGGAIINFPLLLYVPEWFGYLPFTPKEVASISMVQVFFASLTGMLTNRIRARQRESLVHTKLVFHMGSATLAGSLIGSYASMMMSSSLINIIYGFLAVVAAALMIVPMRASLESRRVNEVEYNAYLAAGIAFVIGGIAGIVGAGGAFILIPVMLSMLRIPTRITIASSLAIVFLSAVGGVIGKLAGGDIPLWPTVFAVVGSLLGAPVGILVSRRLNVRVLRFALAVLIAATAFKIWVDILGEI
ncbi:MULTISPECIES: sulfite exporter TauE/SafE family protein [Paenibacillus]|uniref:Probable membrane transporter protein n=1 Tax=Paenibacillus campinasensis TaxID=66347 RepID=A0A268EMW8_9BACL|nr:MULTISPECIES: sulfite exporter TauE/SafE family protein [Paenibacillus]PAD74455.1 hypothetical protein CHH67_17795 [Paenibacillus campinasensis]PAK50800.1 hypothetical protein CHH75_16335 [Paenibacillus sp. 7541]